MKIVTAAGKQRVVMTRKEWEAIGKKAGWEVANDDYGSSQDGQNDLFRQWITEFGDISPELTTAVAHHDWEGIKKINQSLLMDKELDDRILKAVSKLQPILQMGHDDPVPYWESRYPSK